MNLHSTRTLIAVLFTLGASASLAQSSDAPAGPDNPAPTAAGCASTLVVHEAGVALSEFPSRSRLSRSVLIGSPALVSGTSCWTASASVKWLSDNPSGNRLVISANADGRPRDTILTGKVTLTLTSNPTKTATINVALWIGSTDPGIVTLAQSVTSIAASPVEPVAFVSDGTPSVSVFNVYTGELVNTFTPVAPSVGSLVVSSDGGTLFAVDTTNYQIVALNAKNGHVSKRIRLQGPIGSDFTFAYATPAGKATLFAPDQGAIDVATGQVVSNTVTIATGFYDPLITASVDGRRLAIVERGLSPGSLYTYSVSPTTGGEFSVAAAKSGEIVGENCQAMAISADGARLYPACGAPYEFDVYDWGTLQQVQTLAATNYPNNAVIDSNGDFVGGLDGLYDADDVYVFNPKGYSLGMVPTTNQSYSEGQGPNLMAVSGDSTRVISATWYVYGSQYLIFRSLP